MANEETTLEKLVEAQRVVSSARTEAAGHETVLRKLSNDSRLEIGQIEVQLAMDGKVCLERKGGKPWLERLSVDDFWLLMGWGRKHVGDGPDGKSKDEP